jgi:hypothetical protein
VSCDVLDSANEHLVLEHIHFVIRITGILDFLPGEILDFTKCEMNIFRPILLVCAV